MALGISPERMITPVAKKKEETVITSLRLEKAVWRDITKLAEEKHLSMHQAILEAVRQYIAREKGGN
jgi:predicted DNA-binding ribbon-helix-helix protein